MRVSFPVKAGLLSVLTGLLAVVSAAQSQAPVVPAGLTATAGNGQVTLRWGASATATSYHLKRATISSGPFAQIATTTFAGYSDVGRTNGVTYFYEVTAINSVGESANSAAVSAKPAAPTVPQGPNAPAGFTATPGNGLVTLRWSAVSTAKTYHLKRSTSSGGPYAQIAAPWWNGYTDEGAANGATYYYVVAAADATGEGANSAQVSATPVAPVPPVTAVVITPATASSTTSGTLSFSAAVQGTTTNTAVTWKATLGKITAAGGYIAPASAGTDTVTATSNADPT